MMSSIKIVTEIPGPRSRTSSAGAATSIARPLVPGGKIFAASGEGALLTDVDGNRFIDFIGGVGCLVAGHSHPRVVKAVHDQVDAFMHTDFSLLPYQSYIDLATRLSQLCGGGRKAGFFNSGAEAVENAVKVAKAATGRSGIVCFEGAFHGRTLMAMSLTHRDVPYKDGFGPFAQQVYRAPYAGLFGASLKDSVDALTAIFAQHEIAGVIVEPVLGEGGFLPAAEGFLETIATMCNKHGSVFIADEIQSGYGRTGTFLATDRLGVRPDLITLGKSIASGLPLSAIVGDERWLDALSPNTLGGTYVGNPVACAAALAVLDVIDDERLVDRAKLIGEQLFEGWTKIAASGSVIREVRGLGAMVGVCFNDAKTTADVIAKALQRGVLSMSAGREGDVLRHLMPLVITDDQVAEALEIFGACVEES
ncbi:MAG: aminotransferase class III-fold pyridoxal phosphate-dependent enzyme [Actinomycetota bacterium]